VSGKRGSQFIKKLMLYKESVDSIKIWLIGGLTTIVGSLITLIIKTSI
jgi:hypothetical protein